MTNHKADIKFDITGTSVGHIKWWWH